MAQNVPSELLAFSALVLVQPAAALLWRAVRAAWRALRALGSDHETDRESWGC